MLDHHATTPPPMPFRHAPRLLARFLCAAAALGLLLGHPLEARAEDETAQAKAHYTKGKEHLAAGRLEDAIREFKKAYLIKRVPAILFNIAQIYRKLGDNAMAAHFFEKFLQEAPKGDPNRKDAQAILDELKAAGAPKREREAEPKPPAEEPPPPRGETPPPAEKPRVIRGEEPPPQALSKPRKRKPRVDTFVHEAVDEVPPDKPMDVTCQVPDREGVRVTLYYRVAGQESYTPVVMKERLGEWVGRIPAREMYGKSIQYYIEAKDARGKMIGNSGSAANPNIVLISVAARPHYYADMGDEGKGEDFVVAPRRKERPKLDRPPRDLRIWKWAAVGVSAALVGTSVALYTQAARQEATLEDKANTRNGTLPASSFGSKLREIEKAGKLNMMLGSLAVGGAVLFAGGAVVLFIFDESKLIEKAPKEGSRRASIAPVVGPSSLGFVGQVSF